MPGGVAFREMFAAWSTRLARVDENGVVCRAVKAGEEAHFSSVYRRGPRSRVESSLGCKWFVRFLARLSTISRKSLRGSRIILLSPVTISCGENHVGVAQSLRQSHIPIGPMQNRFALTLHFHTNFWEVPSRVRIDHGGSFELLIDGKKMTQKGREELKVFSK